MSVTIDNANKVFFVPTPASPGTTSPAVWPAAHAQSLSRRYRRAGLHPETFSGSIPAWIDRVTVREEDANAVAYDADTLACFVGQGTVAFRVRLRRHHWRHHPDRLIFDLDLRGDDFDAAHAACTRLGDVGPSALVMTNGSSGLQVAVPLDR